MELILIILLAISLFIVLAILVAGLFAFVKGGAFHRKHGNRLMQLRVTAQAIAIILVLLLVIGRTAGD